MIQITINEAYRKFNKSDTFKFDVSPSHILVVVGKNGIGKSSLFRGIRGIKDSLKEINKSNFDGMTISENTLASAEFKSHATVEGLEEFDEIYSLDRITDDPNSFEAAATALGLIAGGGLYAKRMSGGQKSMYMLKRFSDNTKKVHKEGNSSLVLLDEVDTGFDINNQLMYLSAIDNIFKTSLDNPSIVVVTHNSLVPVSMFNKVTVKVYDMDMNTTFDDPREWFYIKTGIKL